MKKEIWHEDQPVLKSDLSLAQSSKEDALKERSVDSFDMGIVQDSQLFAESMPFEITVLTLPLRVNIATGVAYNPEGERIIVDNASLVYDASAPLTAADNGIGGTTLTPQSAGCNTVPLTAGQVNYIFVSYLNTINPNVFTLADVTNKRLFTEGGDGYIIEVVTDPGPSVSSTPNIFAPNANAIYLGAVDTTNIISLAGKSFFALQSKALLVTVPDAVNTLNALGQPYTVGQAVTFEEHVHAIGTGAPTPRNPHGLSIADISGFSGKNSEQHEKLFHESGISGDQFTTTSALYGSTTDSAGSPFIGPTYARDNFLIKKLLPSGTQNFSGNGVAVTFTLTGGLTYIPGSGNLKVFVSGVLQTIPTDYTEISSSSITFATAPAAGAAISLSVDGEAVQVNGITVFSGQITEDNLFYFLTSSGVFLDNGTYTIYLDATLGALRLAHNGSPVNTGYRVRGITSGVFTDLTTLAIATVATNPNNFLLWQVTWGSSPFGIGFDNFSDITDMRYFGTVGSDALRRDALTDTVTIDHNLIVTPPHDNNIMPTGVVLSFAGPKTSLPYRFLYCDGALYDKDDYTNLFNVIGYGWGGDGVQFFRVPDGRGSFIRGTQDIPSYAATINSVTDIITVGMHEYNHSGIPVTVTGTLPPQLIANAPLAKSIYWVIYVSSTTIRLATTHANAIAGTYIDFTATGSGITIHPWLDPEAGLREAAAPGGNSGDSVGTTQDHAAQDHVHQDTYKTNNFADSSNSGGSTPGSDVFRYDEAVYPPSSNVNSFETRPRNISMGFIIKY